MKKSLFVMALMVFVIAVSCTGPKGDTGDIGPVGPTGPGQPGIYYIRLFQQGVYGPTYAGQVQACLNPESNLPFYTSQDMPVAVGKNGLHFNRGIFKFDLTALPSSKIIVEKAELTLNTSSVTAGSGAVDVGVYRVMESWVVNQTSYSLKATGVAWINSGAWDGVANTVTVSAGYYNLPPNSKITIELDPALVQDWMLNPSTNYGVMMKCQDETLLNYSEIYPSLATDPTKRPMLKIWYYTTE